MLTVPTTERRITLRMLSYWEKLRKDRLMPEEIDFDPEDIRDLWDSCFLVPIGDDGTPDHSRTYIGKAIIEAYRHGLSEDDAHLIISPDITMFMQSHHKVLESPKPLLEEGEFSNVLLGIIKYRQCLLPLGKNGRVVAILGGMNFRNFLSEPTRQKIST